MSLLGNSIKTVRESVGMTQKELAKACNLAEITIRQYESGKREPRYDKLENIANALNISVSELMLQGLGPSPKAVKMMDDVLAFAKEVDIKELNNLKLSDFPENLRERINENFDKMNNTGKQKLADYSDDIVEKYQKEPSE